MTPRQYAAANKRIQKLYAQLARALAPIERRLDANVKAFQKAETALRKKFGKKDAPLLRRLAAVRKKFDKRINVIARKIS